MVAGADDYGAVAVGGGGGAGEGAGLVGERGVVAGGGVGPVAFGVGHEADLVVAVAVVEAVDLRGAVAEGEGGLELDVDVGVAFGGAFQGEFEDVVFVDGGFGGGCSLLGCFGDGGCERGEGGGGGELEDFAAVHGGGSLAVGILWRNVGVFLCTRVRGKDAAKGELLCLQNR